MSSFIPIIEILVFLTAFMAPPGTTGFDLSIRGKSVYYENAGEGRWEVREEFGTITYTIADTAITTEVKEHDKKKTAQLGEFLPLPIQKDEPQLKLKNGMLLGITKNATGITYLLKKGEEEVGTFVVTWKSELKKP